MPATVTNNANITEDEFNQLNRGDAARKAYSTGDVELSIHTHNTKPLENTEGHQVFGDRIKSVVYGGMDGIITTFSVVAGASGGGLDVSVILILGFSNMFADALSMGMGDALSGKAEAEYILKEKAREEWELKVNPQGEIDEMIELYVERGMQLDDATKCINLMSKYPEFFINVMMVEELGLQVPAEDDNPWSDGFITFCSFVFFGIFPLLTYVIFPSFVKDELTLFIIACVLTGIMLFILGALKSNFTTSPWWKSGTEMFLFGGLTAAVAYILGWTVKEFLGVEGV
jgi:VIT1/CCC1 family predicted Fe2+/Mn2+ transporter